MTACLRVDTIGKGERSRKEHLQMDVQTSWQAFACTGNILRYLDYKQAQTPDEPPAGDTDHGNFCDTGSGAERDPL